MFTPLATVNMPLFVKCTNWSAALLDTMDTDGVAVTLTNWAPLVALVTKVPVPSKNPLETWLPVQGQGSAGGDGNRPTVHGKCLARRRRAVRNHGSERGSSDIAGSRASISGDLDHAVLDIRAAGITVRAV